MHIPAQWTLWGCTWAFGQEEPHPSFHPGCPGLSFQGAAGRVGTGFWVFSHQLGISRPGGRWLTWLISKFSAKASFGKMNEAYPICESWGSGEDLKPRLLVGYQISSPLWQVFIYFATMSSYITNTLSPFIPLAFHTWLDPWKYQTRDQTFF